MVNIRISILLGLLICMAWSCQQPSTLPRVLIVNSYHEGYAPSDEIMEGLFAGLPADSFELKLVYMDTKRNGSEEFAQSSARDILDVIDEFRPDILLVSDDAAVKYLVVPHLVDSDLPVVFCGVNWSAEQYGLPASNVTGMLEVLPLPETLDLIREIYPQARNLQVISENSVSEHNNTTLLDTLYRNRGWEPDYALVDDFEQWKTAFLAANQSADLIYIPTNGAIQNWDKDEAMAFVSEHIRVPVVSCDDFMVEYAIFGLTKVAREQGEWTAATAKRVLAGEKPLDIPLVKNAQARAWLNEKNATKTGFILPASFQGEVTIINPVNLHE